MTVSEVDGTADVTDLIARSVTPGNKTALYETVFDQVNEHLRATDTKYLQTSLAYLGVMGIVVTILGNQPGVVTSPTWLMVAVTAILFTIGFSVLILQRWYRVWKEHYIQILQHVANQAGWSRDQSILPYWLRETQLEATMTADNVFHYLSLLMTGLVGLVMANALALVTVPASQSTLLVVFTAAYLAGIASLHKFINPHRYQWA